MTIQIHDQFVLRHFGNAQEISNYFELTELPTADFDRLKAESDAGTPTFVAIDPYAKEIDDRRVLIIADTLESLCLSVEAASDGI